MNQPKILFYDIETMLVQALIFSLGKQVVRHNQLMPANQFTEIITIQYCWKHEKKGKVLVVDLENPEETFIKFDKILRQADIVIGKNNTRFDNKHINTQRLLNRNAPGMPEWIQLKSEDLEPQFRRHFNFLSYSLDYISELLGFGGKIKMEFSDWKDIFCYHKLIKIETRAGKEAAKSISDLLFGKSYSEVMRRGRAAKKKMISYGAKDVEDTRDIWVYCEKHLSPRHRMSYANGEKLTCKVCGGTDIRKNGYYTSASQVRYEQYYCNNHNGYAGKRREGSKKNLLT